MPLNDFDQKLEAFYGNSASNRAAHWGRFSLAFDCIKEILLFDNGWHVDGVWRQIALYLLTATLLFSFYAICYVM